MISLRYSGIKKFDIENGLGIGYTLFVQHCTHKCVGCHNPRTWSKEGGHEYTEDLLEDMLEFFKNNPQVKRLTLSGGDPLVNLELSEYVAFKFKEMFPNHKLWIYTGFTYEYLIKHEKYKKLLNVCDILVDGKFDIDKRKPNLKFKGSDNQRCIDIQKSLKEKEIIMLTF